MSDEHNKVSCVARVRRPNGFFLDARMEFPRSGITGLFGPSGSGKTTLLRCIAGLESGAEATVMFGHNCWQDNSRYVPPHQRNTGYVFQDTRLFDHLDVEGNLAFAARRAPAGPITPGVVKSMLDIDGLLHRRVYSLSGGEQRRVALAQALLSQPCLLLLDEPLSGLDSAPRRDILSTLDRLQSDYAIPVVLVSHDLDEVSFLCDYVVVMRGGRICHQGDMAAMLATPDVFGADQCGVIVDAAIEGYDPLKGLTLLSFSGGKLVVPGRFAASSGRVRVLARDVGLALEAASDTSVLNHLAVEVKEVSVEGDYAHVKLACGDTTLLSRISRYSAEVLDLRPGLAITAQVKGVALRTSPDQPISIAPEPGSDAAKSAPTSLEGV